MIEFVSKLAGFLIGKLPTGRRRINASRILASGYFDYEYHAYHLGLKQVDEDFIRNHFLDVGYTSGITPSRYFSKSYYLFQCALFDLDIPKNTTPFENYLSSGWKLGLDPHPLISNKWYLERYPEVAQAEMEPLDHFINFGFREGRNLTPWYSKEQESDSMKLFADPSELEVKGSMFSSKLKLRVACVIFR